MTAANLGSARRWRAVFGRGRKLASNAIFQEKVQKMSRSQKAVRRAAEQTRGPRVLPRSYVNMLSLASYSI